LRPDRSVTVTSSLLAAYTRPSRQQLANPVRPRGDPHDARPASRASDQRL
jgi:hypothetical protein